MIWKNGRFRLSLVGGVLTLLTLFLLPLFFSYSSASAVNLTNASYSNWYTENYFTDPLNLQQSGVRTNTYALQDVINWDQLGSCRGNGNVSCYKNYPYNWYWATPQGINKIQIQYNNVTFTNNAATLHFELNYVLSQVGSPQQLSWYTVNLDNLAILYSNKNINFSRLSYSLTPWQYNTNMNAVFVQQTLTIYGDISFTNLVAGQTDNLIIQIGLPSNYAFILSQNDQWNNTYHYSTFIEQNPTSLDFYATANEALQQAQISATNVTNQLLQRQWEQEQQDRLQLQDASQNASQDGSDATSNAESATSSLLGAITNIYGVLLHPTTTNCNIGPINLYGQLDLGTLNMCTFSIPQPIFAVGALLLIGLIILLAWSVLSAGMSLYNDLLGGKK